MVAAMQISVEEYLHTVYRPDCDYVDGTVIERHAGEKSHWKCQALIYAHFLKLAETLELFPSFEWRVQISPSRYRIPDVCVVAGPEPDEEILTAPPMIVVEVLSPEDRVNALQSRIDDYLRFGVRYVWLVDPTATRAWVHTAQGFYESKDLLLRTENPELTLPLREIFERIR
jgi:Uma2 family endonuclease